MSKPKSEHQNDGTAEYGNLKIADLLNRDHCAEFAKRQDWVGEAVSGLLNAEDKDAFFQLAARNMTTGLNLYEQRDALDQICYIFGIDKPLLRKYLKAKGIISEYV